MSLRSVLEAKGEANAANAAGWTPLLLCAMVDRGDAVELLLKHGADPYQAGPRGRTAMLWADWYRCSSALAVLKAEGRREKREDREGLKRLQTAMKDELGGSLVAALTPAELSAAMDYPGRDFQALLAFALPRQAEVWEPVRMGNSAASKLWLSGEEAEAEAEEAPLQEVLSQADLPGPIGDFPNMKSLVAASRLLVQTKIAGGASGETTDAFALFALSLLGGSALRELNESCAKNETKGWAPSLLRAAASAFRALPAERSVVFRAVRLTGETLAAYRSQLELFAPRRPVSWACPCFGTRDRRVAAAYLDDWSDAALVFKIHCLTARRIHEYSWLAGEDQSPALHESLIAPGTQFESRGLFELSDVALRRDVPMDADLCGKDFAIREDMPLNPLPTSEAPGKRVLLVVLEEVVPAEDIRKYM